MGALRAGGAAGIPHCARPAASAAPLRGTEGPSLHPFPREGDGRSPRSRETLVVLRPFLLLRHLESEG